MRRDLAHFATDHFDLLIIGGGITGACVARDAVLRGLNVALIEKHDFAHATSAHNSKLIHGGLRYLKNGEFTLVRESLRERRIWQRIAPHLVRPLPFLLPVDQGWRDRSILGLGLTLYDLLAYDSGWLDDPAQRLQGHVWFDQNAAIAREPVLDRPGFAGAYGYFDAQMYAPERLALECLLDADANGAVLANYVMAEKLLQQQGRITGAIVRDALSGDPFDIRAKLVLLAAGPWSDLFIDSAMGQRSKYRILRSKGIHLILPALTQNSALTMAAEGGHFFVLPWRGHTLLGTTDTAFTGDPDIVSVTADDIETFLSFVRRHLPASDLRPEQVLHAYAGLRPLVDDGSGNSYGASRRAELIDHSGEGLAGLYSAIGGKWTTSRHLAQTILDRLIKQHDLKTGPCLTATHRLPGGRIDSVQDFHAMLQKDHADLPGRDHLGQLYGARLDDMLQYAGTDQASLGPSGDIPAQILFAIREEMALHLSDVMLRRTGIGQLGLPDKTTIEKCAAIMAAECGWDAQRQAQEIADLRTCYPVQHL